MYDSSELGRLLVVRDLGESEALIDIPVRGRERKETITMHELWRLRINFLLLMILVFIVELGFDTILPTFHQYITNPTAQESNTTESEVNATTLVYPGLGQSELFYSVTITLFSGGAIITGPLVGYLTIWVPYFYLILTSLILHIGANLLSGLASAVWMVAVARFLMGTSFRILYTLSLTYIGNKESNYDRAYKEHKFAHTMVINDEEDIRDEEIDEENITGDEERVEENIIRDEENIRNEATNYQRDEDSRIKKKAYILYSFCTIFPSIIGPGVSSLILQVAAPADLFKWIGCFNATCGGVGIILLLAMFHGEYRKINKKETKSTKDSGKVEMNFTRISMLIFLLCSYGVWKVSSEIFYTLFNPILSDSFGMTEKETSYYFIGLLASYVLGSFSVVILNNVINKYRHLPALVGIYVTLIITSALIADWQTVREDSCKLLSPFTNGGFYNVSKVCEEYEVAEIDWSCCVNSSDDNSNGSQCLPNSFGKHLCLATKECHWNQISIISKSVCLSCPQICRGVQYSLSFIQYTIAAFIFVFVLPAAEVSILILVSNNLRGYEQGPLLGVFNTVTGISGATSPLWIDYIYERSKKRTFPIMAVNIVLLIITLIGLVIFYKILDPPLQQENRSRNILDSDEEDDDDDDDKEADEAL